MGRVGGAAGGGRGRRSGADCAAGALRPPRARRQRENGGCARPSRRCPGTEGLEREGAARWRWAGRVRSGAGPAAAAASCPGGVTVRSSCCGVEVKGGERMAVSSNRAWGPMAAGRFQPHAGL